METFAGPHEFERDPGFPEAREKAIAALDPVSIDAPILDLILRFAGIPRCFTLQSCYGHFVHPGQPDRDGVEFLPPGGSGRVRYRIAYLAVCIENSPEGARLRDDLSAVTAIDREYVQFGSPGWFWEKHLNSYALQVEPERFAGEDEAIVPYDEALYIQVVKDEFFKRLGDVASGRAPR